MNEKIKELAEASNTVIEYTRIECGESDDVGCVCIGMLWELEEE